MIAVTFALFSHAIGYHSYVSGSLFDSRIITRAAMPSLLVLFGVMILKVYAREFKYDKQPVVYRLLYRAFLCYCGFVGLSFAGLLHGQYYLVNLIDSLLFLSPSLYASIFQYYSSLLLLSIPILWSVDRFGANITFSFISLFVIFHSQFILGGPDLAFPFDYLGGFLFGIGSSWGPSLLHGALLVLFGVIMGEVLYSSASSTSSKYLFFSILVLSAVALVFEISNYGFQYFVENICNAGGYRNTNHWIYYAYGALCSVSLAWLGRLMCRMPLGRFGIYLTKLGGSTFSYFFIGNLLILLTPRMEINGVMKFLISGVYLVFASLLSLIWVDALRNRSPVSFFSEQLGIPSRSSSSMSSVQKL